MEQNYDYIDGLCHDLCDRYTNYVIEYIAENRVPPSMVPGFEEELEALQEMSEYLGFACFSFEDIKDSLETFLLIAQFHDDDDAPQPQSIDFELFPDMDDIGLDDVDHDMGPENEEVKENVGTDGERSATVEMDSD